MRSSGLFLYSHNGLDTVARTQMRLPTWEALGRPRYPQRNGREGARPTEGLYPNRVETRV